MIRFDSVDFAFGKHEILKQLDWTLHPGKVYGLLGRNGAGKTTLLHCLCGLLHPQAGSIRVWDHQPQLRSVSFKADIFLVPESFYLPDLSIRQLLKFYGKAYPRFDRQLFDKLLVDLELVNLRHWRKLSYGQKKKLLIALGIAAQTSVLILDEPTNGLDIPAKTQLNRALARLLERKKIIIISTHHIKDVEHLLDHVSILDEGRIRWESSVSRISTAFSFVSSYEKPANSLYSEPMPNGFYSIIPNNDKSEGRVDLELLYKACHQNQAAFTHRTKALHYEIS